MAMNSERDRDAPVNSRRRAWHWCVWIPVVAGGGWLGDRAGIPVGWMIGAMVSGMTLRLLLAPPAGLCNGGTRGGQWLIGIITGSAFSWTFLQSAISFIPLLLFLVVLTGGLCLLNGFFLRRWAGIDASTAFLGPLPGAAAAVVGMAAGLRVNTLAVVMLMYVRIILTILLVPLILSSLVDMPATVAIERAVASPPLEFATLSLLMAIGVACLGKRLRMPSADFLGPFLLFIVIKAIWPEARVGLPQPFFSLGLLLLGASVGTRFDLRALQTLWRPALIQVGLVCALVAACVGAGIVFNALTGVDRITAVLGTTPGGKEAMIALSMALGGNVELVMVMQTFRWLLVMFLGPALALWFARRSERVV